MWANAKYFNDESNWHGQNLLGKVITQVRIEIIHDFGVET